MSVLAADKLMLNPKLYSTFLLWLLSELYSELPEVGDLDMTSMALSGRFRSVMYLCDSVMQAFNAEGE
jgi:Bacterial protein of unknown function (DUF853).